MIDLGVRCAPFNRGVAQDTSPCPAACKADLHGPRNLHAGLRTGIARIGQDGPASGRLRSDAGKSPGLRKFDAATMREMGPRHGPRQTADMRRLAMLFLLAISLAGALAIWPEERSRARAERLAMPLVAELTAPGLSEEALRMRLDGDVLLDNVLLWDESGRLRAKADPTDGRYVLTLQKLRAIEALLSARVTPIWVEAPFAESRSIMRCQRSPDICMVFSEEALAASLDFPPDRLLRPLQGLYALAPALLLGALAFASAFALAWRLLQRRPGSGAT